MSSLEEMWTNALREAEREAARAGRSDVLDYIRLRQTNDAARRVGIEWFLQNFLDVAAEANRRGLNLQIEKSDNHRFPVGAATMQGTKLKISHGVRSITIEAGAPRTPQDGFIRGGGLACARITHFGFAKANSELMLMKSNDQKEAPVWFALGEKNFREEFSVALLKNHFAVFLGQI